MATAQAPVLSDSEQLAGINADYEQRYGFHDAEHYLYKAPKGTHPLHDGSELVDQRLQPGHQTRRRPRGRNRRVGLMSHGMCEDEASKLIVNGFIEPIIKQLPMEYAVEMNRLIELQMESSIG